MITPNFRNVPNDHTELMKFYAALKIPKVTEPPKRKGSFVKVLLKRFKHL